MATIEDELVIDLEEDLSGEELADWLAETSPGEIIAICAWLSNHGEDRIPTSGKPETLLYAISKCDPELVKDGIRAIFANFDDLEEEEEDEMPAPKKSSSKSKSKNPVAYQAVVNCDKDGNIIDDDETDDADDEAEEESEA